MSYIFGGVGSAVSFRPGTKLHGRRSRRVESGSGMSSARVSASLGEGRTPKIWLAERSGAQKTIDHRVSFRRASKRRREKRAQIRQRRGQLRVGRGYRTRRRCGRLRPGRSRARHSSRSPTTSACFMQNRIRLPLCSRGYRRELGLYIGF
jgi:hypothetical protein